MHRFFADAEGILGDTVYLEASDALHAVKVLRLKAGALITVISHQQLYSCRITDISAKSVRAEVLCLLPQTEPRVKVTLFQALPKADKMELIIQKATELGVHRVIPVIMERCVIKTEGRDISARQERWQKIAREASKQSGRSHVPEIAPIAPIKQCAIPQHDLLLAPWEEARTPSLRHVAGQYPHTTTIGLLIGPEGGITDEEMRWLPFLPVTLGPRILRAETASLCALSAIFALYGDLE
jgi:16S rRNA (uracil1498-N3)-methyltransferase